MGKIEISKDGEPSALFPILDALSEAEEFVTCTQYTVPGQVQIKAYARAVLSRLFTPQIADVRAESRQTRADTLVAAGVRITAMTTAEALHNLDVIDGDRDVLRAQLGYLARLVRADMYAGDRSRLRVRIVPAGVVEPLSDRSQPVTDFVSPTDVSRIVTPQRTLVFGPDGYEVDDVTELGMLSELTEERQRIIGQWVAKSVFGEPALEILRQNRDLISA